MNLSIKHLGKYDYGREKLRNNLQLIIKTE